jgi:2'-5' RNA ligase
MSQLQAPLRQTGADVKWTAPNSIHLTLKFLGEIESGVLPSLKAALARAAASHAPFDLTIRGLGAFPGLSNPRVVWCGLDGDVARLAALRQAAEEASVSLGFAPEERPFRPHLTLGRAKGHRNLQALADCIRIGSPLECSFRVDHFHIYRSTLKPAGAVYDVLERISLGA